MEQSEHDIRQIERDRELPPDELYPNRDEAPACARCSQEGLEDDVEWSDDRSAWVCQRCGAAL